MALRQGDDLGSSLKPSLESKFGDSSQVDVTFSVGSTKIKTDDGLVAVTSAATAAATFAAAAAAAAAAASEAVQ